MWEANNTWSKVWLLRLSPEPPISRVHKTPLHRDTSQPHLRADPQTARTGARCSSAPLARSPATAWSRSYTPDPEDRWAPPAHSGPVARVLTVIVPQKQVGPAVGEPEFGRNKPLAPPETRVGPSHLLVVFSIRCYWKVSAPEPTEHTQQTPWRRHAA